MFSFVGEPRTPPKLMFNGGASLKWDVPTIRPASLQVAKRCTSKGELWRTVVQWHRFCRFLLDGIPGFLLNMIKTDNRCPFFNEVSLTTGGKESRIESRLRFAGVLYLQEWFRLVRQLTHNPHLSRFLAPNQSCRCSDKQRTPNHLGTSNLSFHFQTPKDSLSFQATRQRGNSNHRETPTTLQGTFEFSFQQP